MTDDEENDLKRLRESCDALAEHFDSVQIFATRHEAGRQDGTINAKWGAGNWFTRFGQVREWVLYEEENIRQNARPKPE